MAPRPNAPRIERSTGLATGAIAFVRSHDRDDAVRIVEHKLAELQLGTLDIAHTGLVRKEGLPADTPHQLREAYHDAVSTGFGIAVFTE